jgi:hypothetical protein
MMVLNLDLWYCNSSYIQICYFFIGYIYYSKWLMVLDLFQYLLFLKFLLLTVSLNVTIYKLRCFSPEISAYC